MRQNVAVACRRELSNHLQSNPNLQGHNVSTENSAAKVSNLPNLPQAPLNGQSPSPPSLPRKKQVSRQSTMSKTWGSVNENNQASPRPRRQSLPLEPKAKFEQLEQKRIQLDEFEE